jgi:isoleucyl-tRNA synthetase
MAPILSFTAEEVWKLLGKEESVFFVTWHELPRPAHGKALIEKWERLRALRDPVRKQIETLRAEGKAGSSLQAEVELQADDEDYARLASLEDELKYLLLTSAATVRRGALSARARPSDHAKCERCWHYRADVNGEGLCGRCQTNLRGPGETRKYV